MFYLHRCYSHVVVFCHADLPVAVLGFKQSSTSRQLVDKRRRDSRPIRVFRVASEQATCDTAAAAVSVPGTVAHRHKSVSVPLHSVDMCCRIIETI